uniref:Uncharacterized protein n=1 Tax=Amphimedon queenslandica TaxID=400682 RepID=A0A1X7VR24_AMPQE
SVISHFWYIKLDYKNEKRKNSEVSVKQNILKTKLKYKDLVLQVFLGV